MLELPVLCAPVAEALTAIGDSNAENWVVVRKGVPLLIQMLEAAEPAQAEAAVRVIGYRRYFPITECTAEVHRPGALPRASPCGCYSNFM